VAFRKQLVAALTREAFDEALSKAGRGP
jgi:hypothetical protein